MLITCTLCGRLFVGTAEQSASPVRRCKYHPDVTKGYGYRFIEPVRACEGCGRTASCAQLWPEQKKCCPDCSCAETFPERPPCEVCGQHKPDVSYREDPYEADVGERPGVMRWLCDSCEEDIAADI